MAEVQSPLPANAAPAMPTSGVDKDALIARLDTLLEQYLHTLDSYEKLMQQLSKQLSSGYFSLTQANFHNRSGVHYGQDSYDERVQATRKILVTEGEESKLHFSTISTSSSTASKSSKPAQDDEKEHSKKTEQDSPVSEEPEISRDEPGDDSTKATGEKSDAEKPGGRDPIRMFGILVPPALRSAQTSFKDAVDGPVVRLAAVTGELRALEREIGRARKMVRKA